METMHSVVEFARKSGTSCPLFHVIDAVDILGRTHCQRPIFVRSRAETRLQGNPCQPPQKRRYDRDPKTIAV